MQKHNALPYFGANGSAARHLDLAGLGQLPARRRTHRRVIDALMRRKRHEGAILNRHSDDIALDYAVRFDGTKKWRCFARRDRPLMHGAMVGLPRTRDANTATPFLLQEVQRLSNSVRDEDHDCGTLVRAAACCGENSAFAVKKTGCVLIRNHADNMAQSRTNFKVAA